MKRKIKCIVLDDEELARLLIENYIKRLSNLELIGSFSNPIEAIQFIQKEEIDIIFLDIQMPDMTGIEFLSSLTRRPFVVFTTSYKEYALTGYDLDVVDYLLKPFRFERFLKAVNKATWMIQNVSNPRNAETVNRPLEIDNANKSYILVKSEFKTFKIEFDDILYIESMSEYVAFYTKDQRIISLGSLKRLEDELPQKKFIRIHKSFIVNIYYISAFEGNMVHIGSKKLPIGGSYKEALKRLIF